LWWPSLTKDMQTEQLMCWNGMTDREHNTTSGSNETFEKCQKPASALQNKHSYYLEIHSCFAQKNLIRARNWRKMITLEIF